MVTLSSKAKRPAYARAPNCGSTGRRGMSPSTLPSAFDFHRGRNPLRSRFPELWIGCIPRTLKKVEGRYTQLTLRQNQRSATWFRFPSVRNVVCQAVFITQCREQSKKHTASAKAAESNSLRHGDGAFPTFHFSQSFRGQSKSQGQSDASVSECYSLLGGTHLKKLTTRAESKYGRNCGSMLNPIFMRNGKRCSPTVSP